MDKEREIKTSLGTIRNVNSKKLTKTKTYKFAAKAACSVALVVVVGLNLIGCNQNTISPIPEHQTQIILSVEVENGDTLSEIAEKYYSNDCDGVYNSFSNYEDEIKEQNNISKYGDHIETGDVIKIPVIVDLDNPYYMQVLEIENAINQVKQDKLWIKYVVKAGDSVTSLAALASGSYQETYEIAGKIVSKNNLANKSILNEGQEIWIMNPELGKLKEVLGSSYEQLEQNLIRSQIKK